MHDIMQYDPIEGQGRGHEPFKVGISAIFKGYLLPQLWWGLASDHGFFSWGTIPEAYRGQIFEFCPSFCVTLLRSWQ